ncbi:MAG: HemK2/MTQ2 family protein methyltransferase [Candidatus Nanohaloarchaea archaeon]|nr:HemK2/MTQ2 family protein methyltransferase [Candidatus Nanohaloarchaea archaeon]
MSKEVYRPRKDSFLLKEVMEEQDLEGKEVLDMGTGSGILALSAAGRGAETTAVDVNPEALEVIEEKAEERGLEVRVLESDLFDGVEDEFDLIVFNPPYVPGSEEGLEGEEAWNGGEDGRKITDRFVEQVGNYLKEGGKVLMVQSSRNDPEETLEAFTEKGMEAQIVRREKLHFEELVVVEASRSV